MASIHISSAFSYVESKRYPKLTKPVLDACSDTLYKLMTAPSDAIVTPAQMFVQCVKDCTPEHSSR